MNNFSREQIQYARRADLYRYLLQHHSDVFTIEGNSIRPIWNHSISIRRGYSGYMDFANNETGNSVDFLVRHMNYSIVEAVLSLGEGVPSSSDNTRRSRISTSQETKIMLPKPTQQPYTRLIEYMVLERGISADIIHMLVGKGLIYQEKQYDNIVFVNAEKDWAELHGTREEASFHGIAQHSRPDGYWMFSACEAPSVVFICEAALDAIALYVLQIEKGLGKAAGYISIGGAGKQSTINRIRKEYTAIMAVDNDHAGEECRQRNSDLRYIIPQGKDWNEDLLALAQSPFLDTGYNLIEANP